MGYGTALLSYPVTLNFLASRSYRTLRILNRDLRQTTWRHGRCTGIGSCTKLWSISIRWDLKHWMRIYLKSKWSWYSGTAVIESDNLLLETCPLQTVSMGIVHVQMYWLTQFCTDIQGQFFMGKSQCNQAVQTAILLLVIILALLCFTWTVWLDNMLIIQR